jgi:hypothetical protein
MRFSQPSRATQLKIQASSAWPETWLWLKTMLLLRDRCRLAMIGRGHLAGGALQLGGAAPDVQRHGDRVQIDDAIDAVMGLLHLRPNCTMAPR